MRPGTGPTNDCAEASIIARRDPSPACALDPARRTFLQAGIGGSAVLLLGRWLPSAAAQTASDVGFPTVNLTPPDVVALARIVPVMLAGALPQDRAGRETAIGEVIQGVDATIGYQPPLVRREIRDLFGLLTKGVTRALVAGIWTSWEKATDDDVAEFLAGWRTSRFDLLRSAYIGLNNLIVGSWYANPQSWARIGYGGPPTIA